SLHRGDPKQPGVSQTVPMHGLVAADLDGSSEFELLTSLEVVGAPAVVSLEGHIYGSENQVGKAALFGRPPADLAMRLRAAADRIRRQLGGRAGAMTVESILKDWATRGAPWARASLEEIVANYPDDLIAWYWLGTAAQRDLADPAGASAA